MTNLGSFAAAAYQTWLLQNATKRLASIVESSDDAIISKDLNGIIVTWNKGAQQIFGYSANEMLGKPITILIPPDRHNEEVSILGRIRLGERIDHFETVRQRKDGSLVDISLTVSPIRNAEGEVVGASKIARDITDRKRSDEQVALLAREAEHRARNVLATVHATIHLTEAETPEGLKQAIEGRIKALSNVHTLFIESRWAGAELRSLVENELAAYSQDGGERTRIDGPNLLLRPENAQAVAVVVHELATNAAKYGALSATAGRVQVEWSLGRDGLLVLRWTETAGPLVNPPTRQGFGMRVMKGLIEDQLKGEVRLEWRAQGLRMRDCLARRRIDDPARMPMTVPGQVRAWRRGSRRVRCTPG